MLKEKGLDPTLLQQQSYDWTNLGDILEEWLDKAAHYIALAIASATAIIDFEVAIVDGTMPANVREVLVEKIRDAISQRTWQGIELPVVLEGTLGSPARALGRSQPAPVHPLSARPEHAVQPRLNRLFVLKTLEMAIRRPKGWP